MISSKSRRKLIAVLLLLLLGLLTALMLQANWRNYYSAIETEPPGRTTNGVPYSFASSQPADSFPSGSSGSAGGLPRRQSNDFEFFTGPSPDPVTPAGDDHGTNCADCHDQTPTPSPAEQSSQTGESAATAPEALQGGTYQVLSTVVTNGVYDFQSETVSATTGDVTSTGNMANDMIRTWAWAVADDVQATNFRSLVLSAFNSSTSGIDNTGTSIASSGDALARDILMQNDVTRDTAVSILAPILGPRSSIEVDLETTYNIHAKITGNATARTGDVQAAGNQSTSSIENYLRALTVNQAEAEQGDNAPAVLLGEQTAVTKARSFQFGDGPAPHSGESSGPKNGNAKAGADTVGHGWPTFTRAKSTTETDVAIDNNGEASAKSGPASAVGVLVNNLIRTDLLLDFAFGTLAENSRANITINVLYNVIAKIFGDADAMTGNAMASGNEFSTTVDSNTQSRAALNGGDPDTDAASDSYGSMDGQRRLASNKTATDIDNVGAADASSGPASAIGVLIQNLIQTNVLMDLTFSALHADSRVNVAVNVVYNLVAEITGNASATTGDATANGNSATSDVRNESTAQSDILPNEPATEKTQGAADGPRQSARLAAAGITKVLTESDGDAKATSGEASAIGVLVENPIYHSLVVNLTLGGLEDGETYDFTTNLIFDIYAEFNGIATSTSGDAAATGNIATSTIGVVSEAESLQTAQGTHNAPGRQKLTARNLNNTTVKSGGSAVAKTGSAQAVGVVAVNNEATDPEGEGSHERVDVDGSTEQYTAQVTDNLEENGESIATSGDATAVGATSQTTVQNETAATASTNDPALLSDTGTPAELGESQASGTPSSDDNDASTATSSGDDQGALTPAAGGTGSLAHNPKAVEPAARRNDDPQLEPEPPDDNTKSE